MKKALNSILRGTNPILWGSKCCELFDMAQVPRGRSNIM